MPKNLTLTGEDVMRVSRILIPVGWACGPARVLNAAGAWSTVLLRLACPGVTSAFAVLRLFPMSGRDRTVEILALRHRITALERQLGGSRT
ncbi:hypothetical protein ABZV61_20810 [Streptomyces sp900116325]|uniref:Uncharacterized protein n=1 Tax=Streptomyces sp. 900116325 TaxID=3154295 RepID=A0ABV2UBG0_9ACTN